MECPRCGKRNEGGRKYCIRCGAPLLSDENHHEQDVIQHVEPVVPASAEDFGSDTDVYEPESYVPETRAEESAAQQLIWGDAKQDHKEARARDAARAHGDKDEGHTEEHEEPDDEGDELEGQLTPEELYRSKKKVMAVAKEVANLCERERYRSKKNVMAVVIITCLLSFIVPLVIAVVTDDLFTDDSGSSESAVDDTPEAALEEAKSYLRSSAFSRSGLIEQLKYEGYSEENATYAVDNVGADWAEQALLAAQDYVDVTAISNEHLYNMMSYEGFTDDQTDYAMANVKADWKAEAAERAKERLDARDYTRDELVEKLVEYDGFTQEQAEYGVAQAGM